MKNFFDIKKSVFFLIVTAEDRKDLGVHGFCPRLKLFLQLRCQFGPCYQKLQLHQMIQLITERQCHNIAVFAALLHMGIDRIAGLVITDVDGMKNKIVNEISGPPYPMGKPFLLKKENV